MCEHEALACARRSGALEDEPHTKKELAEEMDLQNSFWKTPQALHSIAARSQRSLGHACFCLRRTASCFKKKRRIHTAKEGDSDNKLISM